MSATELKLQGLASNILNYGLGRQALINGNFDVWQRGTSVTPADAAITYQADRWRDYISKDGGTLPTLTRSRQILTSGDISNAFYYSRLAFNGAGTSLGTNSVHVYFQSVENGTRNLAGLNKKVTISFWARSNVANKRLGIQLDQNYGSGGSPTSNEAINGTNITLTSTWTKYSYTITTNTLSGKTFGTANDDALIPYFWIVWGDSKKSLVGAANAETYVGSGYVDIAQVQLCAGDTALPFQPKSYNEELLNCQRYFEFLDGNLGRVSTTTEGLICAHFKISKHRNVANADIVFIGSSDNCSEVGVGSRKFTGGSINRPGTYSAEIVLTGASGMSGTNLILIYNNQIAINTEL